MGTSFCWTSITSKAPCCAVRRSCGRMDGSSLSRAITGRRSASVRAVGDRGQQFVPARRVQESLKQTVEPFQVGQRRDLGPHALGGRTQLLAPLAEQDLAGFLHTPPGLAPGLALGASLGKD